MKNFRLTGKYNYLSPKANCDNKEEKINREMGLHRSGQVRSGEGSLLQYTVGNGCGCGCGLAGWLAGWGMRTAADAAAAEHTCLGGRREGGCRGRGRRSAV